MKVFPSKYMRLVVVAGLIIITDQITKAIILKSMPLYHSVPVIPGFFNITHIHNPGGAFGFLANQSSNLRAVVFLLISALAVGLIFWFYKNTPKTHPWLATAFAMIFGGAIGNLIDRIRFGKVVDFLDVYLGHLHWPAFNVADSAIVIGIVIFIFHLIFNKLPQ
jgi:signal peptidase II